MKKQHTAILAAFLITACVGLGMLLVGGSALLNKHGVTAANTAADAAVNAQAGSADPAQVQQLQDLVNQYQAREAQYQQELQTAGQNLQQANEQIQQYQRLLMALQDRGLLRISDDGRIFINE